MNFKTFIAFFLAFYSTSAFAQKSATIKVTYFPANTMVDGQSKFVAPNYIFLETTNLNCFSFLDVFVYVKASGVKDRPYRYKISIVNNSSYEVGVSYKTNFESGGRWFAQPNGGRKNFITSLTNDDNPSITIRNIELKFTKAIQEQYNVSALSGYLDCNETISSYLSNAKKENKKESTNDQKDFWSGEDDKKQEVNDNKKDDFWSGGSEKEGIKKETDFWAGKGNTAEEKQLTENTKPDESDQFLGNVRSRTGRVRIYCEDTGQEDGDLVRITNNGTILRDKIYLTNAGRSYWFDLEFGQNNIEILALNQGSVGANTAAFKVFDDKGNQIAEKSWHLKTGYKGKLLILKL